MNHSTISSPAEEGAHFQEAIDREQDHGRSEPVVDNDTLVFDYLDTLEPYEWEMILNQFQDSQCDGKAVASESESESGREGQGVEQTR